MNKFIVYLPSSLKAFDNLEEKTVTAIRDKINNFCWKDLNYKKEVIPGATELKQYAYGEFRIICSEWQNDNTKILLVLYVYKKETQYEDRFWETKEDTNTNAEERKEDLTKLDNSDKTFNEWKNFLEKKEKFDVVDC